MNAPINDGGPAFPGEQGVSGYGASKPIIHPGGTQNWIELNQGMTLRAYIATEALAATIGLMNSASDVMKAVKQSGTSTPHELAAVAAVAFADALIEELSKKP